MLPQGGSLTLLSQLTSVSQHSTRMVKETWIQFTQLKNFWPTTSTQQLVFNTKSSIRFTIQPSRVESGGTMVSECQRSQSKKQSSMTQNNTQVLTYCQKPLNFKRTKIKSRREFQSRSLNQNWRLEGTLSRRLVLVLQGKWTPRRFKRRLLLCLSLSTRSPKAAQWSNKKTLSPTNSKCTNNNKKWKHTTKWKWTKTAPTCCSPRSSTACKWTWIKSNSTSRWSPCHTTHALPTTMTASQSTLTPRCTGLTPLVTCRRLFPQARLPTRVRAFTISSASSEINSK